MSSSAFIRKEEILGVLNEQQKAAVRDYTGLCIVSAGPGAGKTKTLVSRAAYMIADGIDPRNILLFTFTRKAAEEIKDRIMAMVGEQGKFITIATYHSFCAKLLRRYYDLVGLQKNFSIFDDTEKEKIVKKTLKDNDWSVPTVEDCLSAITRYKERYILPSKALADTDFKDENDFDRRRALVYDTYQRTLLENNAADFDDLICHMITILENHVEVQHIIWNKYKYITADEGQDSGTSDLRFIFNLIPPRGYNLCFLQDTDQSIYGFRGANFRELYHRIKQYPDCKYFFLEQNYRSTQNIVNASQSLIAHNHRPDEKKIFSKNAKGSKIYLKEPTTPIKEANDIAGIILRLKKANMIKEYGEVAVLYRNLYLGKDIEDAFMKNKIPYKVISGTSFYERAEVRDILAYLEFLENPQNLIALQRIIDIPKVGIGEVTFNKIKEELLAAFKIYGIIDLDGMLKILEDISKKFKKAALFYANISAIAEIISERPDRVIQTIVESVNYPEYLRNSVLKEDEDIGERLKNIQSLMSLAAEYPTVRDFLDSVTLSKENDDENLDDEKCVKLMSIHASKGLEFTVVFVVGVNEGILPSIRSVTPEEKEEERRLLYVAMTRAKELLVLSAPHNRIIYGKQVYQQKSSFLSEIDSEYLISN